MAVDIQEVAARIDDLEPGPVRDMRPDPQPDPVRLARTLRQMRERARWLEERLQP